MHEHFADWYRPCADRDRNFTDRRTAPETMDRSGEARERFSGARATVREDRPAEQSAPAEILENVRSIFKEADATFQMSGNDLGLERPGRVDS